MATIASTRHTEVIPPTRDRSEVDVSVVVCVRNSAIHLKPCLESVRANSPCELIVVDGLSTDGSFEIARLYADKVLSDEGRGLAAARQLGVEACRGTYVFHIGPDNILPRGFLSRLVCLAEQYDYAATGVETRLQRIGTFWDRCLDDWWRFKVPVGPREVVGTPSLFRRDLLIREQFNPAAGMADDTDLCSRLRNKGHELGVVPLAVYEVGGWHWNDVVRRFSVYGMSDAQFYALHSADWKFFRKLRSWAHPLRHTWNGCVWAIKQGGIRIIPFFVIVGFLRYASWISHARTLRAQQKS